MAHTPSCSAQVHRFALAFSSGVVLLVLTLAAAPGCATVVAEEPAGQKGDVPALPDVADAGGGSVVVDAGDAAVSPSDSGDATADAGRSVQGCGEADFVDRTAATAMRTLTWDFDAGSVPERCLKVQVGQTVTWAGNFTLHPLAGGGGDAPNPIDGAQVAGGMATFPNAGTFGYFCDNHGFMKGAIHVVS